MKEWNQNNEIISVVPGDLVTIHVNDYGIIRFVKAELPESYRGPEDKEFEMVLPF